VADVSGRGGGGGSPPVDFLIAGVQKGGTFSLYRLLERHPEISLSKAKEVHFFDNEAIDRSSPRYGEYHRTFSRRPMFLCSTAET
jgi:hypothetical protein